MFLSREQARAIDRKAIDEFGIPGVVLMENAGRGIAELLLSLGVQGPVVVCCGPGNNGGDGFVIARHLSKAGVAVRVLLFARPENLAGDAAINYRAIATGGIAVEVFAPPEPDEARLRGRLASADWVVDALFGTGQVGPVRPPLDRVITAINESGCRVLAVDLPSGMEAESGQAQTPTIRADHTGTMVAPKRGFANPDALPWLGKVHVIDIGFVP